jgi:hypothetical protein
VTYDLPTDTSSLFAGSGTCVICHAAAQSDDALRDDAGTDVSPVTLWRSTMMANAARDPLFQAKVAAEVSDFPGLQTVIEDKCTTCHMPMGRTEAVLGGPPPYSMDEAMADALAMDAVSCTLCHQVADQGLGEEVSFSGGYVIGTDRIIFGPYDDGLSSFMEFTVDYTVAQTEHIQGSALCATCHTLFTPTVDYEGNLTGGAIAEQTPYLEWENSVYDDQEVECQTCHMPELETPIKISTVPASSPERGPFSRHYFVGGNAFMLDILRHNAELLGATAETHHFDSTTARTLDQLQVHAADIEAVPSWIDGDSLQIVVTVSNKTGHKLPTGFPSRRMWLYVRVCLPDGTVLFESGEWDAQTGVLLDEDAPFERHHDVIRSADQVAVYQSVMGDVNGDPTWTLLRGASYLKDNRIPPVGFTSSGPHADVTAIVGEATADPNFNRTNGAEGSGSDAVTFRIGNLDGSSRYDIKIRLAYQSLVPAFAEDLFEYSLPEVEQFEALYKSANPEPVIMQALTFSVDPVAVEDVDAGQPDSHHPLRLFPSPASGFVTIEFETRMAGPVRVSIFDMAGRRVSSQTRSLEAGPQIETIDLQDIPSGMYVCRVKTATEVYRAELLVVH